MVKDYKVALKSDSSLLSKTEKNSTEEVNLKNGLEPRYDLYDLPGGDTLIIAKEDYHLDCVPAIITKDGDVYGIAFSFQNNDAISNGDHSFKNGAVGKVYRGDNIYHYMTPQGKPFKIALKEKIH